MRQLTYVEAGVIRWREVPDPVLADPAGALVAPLAVARCDLDLPMAAQGLFPGPFGVGHETVAEVVAVGPEVARVGRQRRRRLPHGRRAAARLGADPLLHQGPWPRSFERAAVTVENTMATDGLACTPRSTDAWLEPAVKLVVSRSA